jgi:hypothetical protein
MRYQITCSSYPVTNHRFVLKGHMAPEPADGGPNAADRADDMVSTKLWGLIPGVLGSLQNMGTAEAIWESSALR